MIIESLSFCHYDTIFGLFLGLFQYLPIILYFGAWFWALSNRDSLFVGLGWAMNIGWVGGILFKFLAIPMFVSLPPILIVKTCGSFMPSVLGAITGIVFAPGTLYSVNGSLVLQGADFPHLDVLESGIYNGYMIMFIMNWGWRDKFSYLFLLAILAISFIPWSFISAGVTSSGVIGTSFAAGFGIGILSLIIVYKLVQRVNQAKAGRNVEYSRWFTCCCGDPNPAQSLFYK